MSVGFTQSDSTIAHFLYKLHGMVSQPTYRVIEYFTRYGNPVDPTVFDNCSTKVREYAYRSFGPAALIGAAAFLAKKATLPQVRLLAVGLLAFEVGRLVLHLLACFFQKKNYIHVRGNGKENLPDDPTIMSWNMLGFPAGMNYTCGGCIPFRHRFERIAEKIRSENPDIVVLQECWMDASVSEDFVNEFKDDYAHFFIHNGPSKIGLESGLLVMTKCPVASYTFTPFDNNDWTLNRGFAALVIPTNNYSSSFTVVGTHLHGGSTPEDLKRQKSQLSQIQARAKSPENARVFLAGDLNMDAANSEVKKTLLEVLDSVYSDSSPETCTTELNKIRYPKDRDPSKEWIDQISIVKEAQHRQYFIRRKVILAYERERGKINSRTALSDHNAVVAVLHHS